MSQHGERGWLSGPGYDQAICIEDGSGFPFSLDDVHALTMRPDFPDPNIKFIRLADVLLVRILDHSVLAPEHAEEQFTWANEHYTGLQSRGLNVPARTTWVIPDIDPMVRIPLAFTATAYLGNSPSYIDVDTSSRRYQDEQLTITGQLAKMLQTGNPDDYLYDIHREDNWGPGSTLIDLDPYKGDTTTFSSSCDSLRSWVGQLVASEARTSMLETLAGLSTQYEA
jgi:hypothetical protein